MMRRKFLCATIAALAVTASAEVYLVTPDGSGDFPTLQAAIAAVSDGDVIELSDGLFVGEGNHGIDFAGKAITLRSISGDPHACVIDCESQDRAFVFESGEGLTSVLDGIGMIHGRAHLYGGAIRCRQAGPTISKCRFENNYAYDMEMGGCGGAIDCSESNACIVDCEFVANAVSPSIYWGGGLGGAISIGGAAPTILHCDFFSNECVASGGGIYVADSAPTIEGCTFFENWWRGISFHNSAGEVVDCTFRSNWGGVLCWSGSSTTFTGCVFSHEETNIGSACDCFIDASPAFINCTIYANGATSRGAGLNCEEGSFPILSNVIIAFSAEGEAIWCDASSGATLSCCDLYGNAGGDWSGCIAGQLGTDGNICHDPLFCDAPNDDLTLAANSPCSPTYAPAGCDLIGALPVGCGAASAERPGLPAASDAILQLRTAAQPVSSRAQFELVLQRSGRLRVAIHDVCGARIRTLADDPRPAGLATLEWDARDSEGLRVSPGVYFVRCTLGAARANGRVLIVR